MWRRFWTTLGRRINLIFIVVDLWLSAYQGKGGYDTFFADFSSWTEKVEWTNGKNATTSYLSDEAVNTLGAIHQVKVSGMETLLLLTGSGNDVITQNVTGTNDEFRLGAGNDYASAGDGNDIIYGEEGDDTIVGGTGNDTIDGGAGTDTAVFSGVRASYTVTPATNGFKVVGPDGTDSLSGIEFLQFNDATVALATAGMSTYALVANAMSVNEGRALTYTLTTTNVTAGTVLNYTLSGVSAADVVGGALTGTVTVASTGVTTFSVALEADKLTEGAETLVAKVSSASVAVLATAMGVVINDTSTSNSTVPVIALSSSTAAITEGNSASQPLTFTVTLSAASASTVTVNYATANGTATAGSDYIPSSGVLSVLTFAPGETSKTVAVSVLGDTVAEANETFTLNLSSPSGATLGAISSATATIINDDSNTGGNLLPTPTNAAFLEALDNDTQSIAAETDFNGALYVLSTQVLSASDYRIDPDGSKSYKAAVIVTKIIDGQVSTQAEIAQLYAGGLGNANDGAALDRGTIGVVNGNLKVFFGEKTSSVDYGQNGYTYSVDPTSLASDAATPLFTNANWGWYPRIDSNGDVLHFSYAGYILVKNAVTQSSITPEAAVTASQNHKLVLAGLSGNLISPSASFS